jgi:5,5'-dehydrodivanillate O-demethylase
MVLSYDENALLTKVGPGTPMGELFRRYWHPVGFSKELKDRPKKRKILGEELVLFRDRAGHVGLLGLHCSHRGMSLEYGHIKDRGIQCAYHGWQYDISGQCLDQPAEPRDKSFKDKIQHPAYKVQELGGILWTYMGPEPAPLLPRWDVVARDDGVRSMRCRLVNCNFLQMAENSVDPIHLQYLHRDVFVIPSEQPGGPTWEHNDFGIKNTMTCVVSESFTYTHVYYFIMPAVNRHGNPLKGDSKVYDIMRWRIPMDDTHTWNMAVAFVPAKDGEAAEPSYDVLDDQENGFVESQAGVYRWDNSINWIAGGDQDRCAQESQGPVMDRTREHLGTIDRGVIMLRRMYLDSLDALKEGRDPHGLIRDSAKNQLIALKTNVDSLRVHLGQYSIEGQVAR